MSNQAMIAAETRVAEILANKAKFSQKTKECSDLANESRTKVAALELAHTMLERRYVCDEASLAAVAISRQELEKERAQLEEVERLGQLAADAIQDVERELQKAGNAMREAQSQYCLSLSVQILSEIKSDRKFKERLLQAMAVSAANGLTQYTTDPQSFVNQHISRILPVITTDEVNAAIEKFKQTYGLD